MGKIKLSNDVKKLHKTSTVVMSIFLISLSLLQIIQPYIGTLQVVMSPTIFPWVSAVFGILIGVGRYIKQDLQDGKLDGKIDKEVEDNVE